MTSEDKYIEASSRARWIFGCFIIIASITGYYFYFKYSNIGGPENTSIELQQELTREYRYLIRQTLVANFLFAIVFCPYFLRLGYRTFKHKEYPPPDTAVVFRTKVAKGRMALASAVGCFLIGLFSGFGFIISLYIEYVFFKFT